MRQSTEATAVAPTQIFFFLNKENQLTEKPEITESFKNYYATNNQLALLDTLKEAHSCLLEVYGKNLTKEHVSNIQTLITFVAELTHFQTLKTK